MWALPQEIALMPEMPGGGSTETPPPGSPHVTTVPSDLSAAVKYASPASMATMFVNPGGTFVSPCSFPPQAITRVIVPALAPDAASKPSVTTAIPSIRERRPFLPGQAFEKMWYAPMTDWVFCGRRVTISNGDGQDFTLANLPPTARVKPGFPACVEDSLFMAAPVIRI